MLLRCCDGPCVPCPHPLLSPSFRCHFSFRMCQLSLIVNCSDPLSQTFPACLPLCRADSCISFGAELCSLSALCRADSCISFGAELYITLVMIFVGPLLKSYAPLSCPFTCTNRTAVKSWGRHFYLKLSVHMCFFNIETYSVCPFNDLPSLV